MRALFIQHDPGSQPGLVGRALERRGFELELLPMARSITEPVWHGAFPRAAEFDVVIPLGAVWSLYDRSAVGSWIDRELDLLRDADEQGVPVLGICFGGQALAAAHGGRVEPSPVKEVGFTPIDTDDADLVPPGPWMQWHSDRFTLPAGAVEIARNDVGPQAFRLRRNLGLQFHPEVDEGIVGSWIAMGGELATTDIAAAGRTLDEVLEGVRREVARAAEDVERLVDGFLTDVAGLR